MTRCRVAFAGLVAALALSFSVGTHAAQLRFEQSGKLKSSAGERAAGLQIGCAADADGGSLSIDLVVLEADKHKDFDYADFEGPDAAAAKHALSRLSWTADAAKTEISHAASGWYAPEPPDAFMFGVTQPSHRAGPVAHLLQSIGKGGGRFVWLQTAFDNPKHQLVAGFELDAAAAQRVHETIAACLPTR